MEIKSIFDLFIDDHNVDIIVLSILKKVDHELVEN